MSKKSKKYPGELSRKGLHQKINEHMQIVLEATSHCTSMDYKQNNLTLT